jgi:hypothetical protein
MKGLKKSDIPGVGSYNVGLYDVNKTKKGYSLGKSNRFKNYQVFQVFFVFVLLRLVVLLI